MLVICNLCQVELQGVFGGALVVKPDLAVIADNHPGHIVDFMGVGKCLVNGGAPVLFAVLPQIKINSGPLQFDDDL